MRTAQEFRDRQLEVVKNALRRPTMFCGHADCADVFFGKVHGDLCWLDDLSDEETRSSTSLEWSSMRVYGQFYFQHCKIPSFINEIASTYCQIFYRTGHFHPERLLGVSEFDELSAALDEKFFAIDHVESELLARFGRPSHVFGGETTVHTFACEDRNRDWIYFDYTRCSLHTPRVEDPCFDDPILRDVRRNRNQFEFLPFGASCRPNTPPGSDI